MKSALSISGMIAGMIVGIVLLAGACAKTSVSESVESTQHSDSANNPQISETAGSQSANATDSDTPFFLDPSVLDLNTSRAVALLNLEGVSGEDTCGDRHTLETKPIPDYTKRQESGLVPTITSALAPIYAIGAAGVVLHSQDSLIRAWANPDPAQLVCISRVMAAPELDSKWVELSFLIRQGWHIEGVSPPYRLATAALRSGEAIVFGCLTEEFGNIYNNLGEFIREAGGQTLSGKSSIFESHLAWIGNRFRVQTFEIVENTTCDLLPQLIKEKQEDLQPDIDAGFEWISEEDWIWTDKEIREWLNQ